MGGGQIEDIPRLQGGSGINGFRLDFLLAAAKEIFAVALNRDPEDLRSFRKFLQHALAVGSRHGARQLGDCEVGHSLRLYVIGIAFPVHSARDEGGCQGGSRSRGKQWLKSHGFTSSAILPSSILYS